MPAVPPHFIPIHIEPQAPRKPALGAACNGCGVCCLAEPCPVGMLVSGRRHGACAALRWEATGRWYRCGLIGPRVAVAHVLRALPRAWLVRAALVGLAPLLAQLGARWVGAGIGCDCSLEVAASGTIDAAATPPESP